MGYIISLLPGILAFISYILCNMYFYMPHLLKQTTYVASVYNFKPKNHILRYTYFQNFFCSSLYNDPCNRSYKLATKTEIILIGDLFSTLTDYMGLSGMLVNVI